LQLAKTHGGSAHKLIEKQSGKVVTFFKNKKDLMGLAYHDRDSTRELIDKQSDKIIPFFKNVDHVLQLAKADYMSAYVLTLKQSDKIVPIFKTIENVTSLAKIHSGIAAQFIFKHQKKLAPSLKKALKLKGRINFSSAEKLIESMLKSKKHALITPKKTGFFNKSHPKTSVKNGEKLYRNQPNYN